MEAASNAPNDRVARITRTIDRARNLRQEDTFPERLLWGRLRHRPGGFKFRRQDPVGQYFADFCCIEARLIIEIDGRSHQGREEYDSSRQLWIESQGFEVMRFTNDEVLKALDVVVESIVSKCQVRGANLPSPGHAEA